MRPIQSRNTTVMPSNMGGGNDEQGPEDEDPTIDFGDPNALSGLSGVSHDRQQVYINPQDLRDHVPAAPPSVVPQPSTSAAGIRPPPPPQPPHPTQPPLLTTSHAQHGQTHLATPGTATPADTPVFTFAVTQDVLSRCLQHMSMQTKIAQERLEILRRREAREISEWNSRKDAEKNAMAKDKTVKAFVSLSFWSQQLVCLIVTIRNYSTMQTQVSGKRQQTTYAKCFCKINQRNSCNSSLQQLCNSNSDHL